MLSNFQIQDWYFQFFSVISYPKLENYQLVSSEFAPSKLRRLQSALGEWLQRVFGQLEGKKNPLNVSLSHTCTS